MCVQKRMNTEVTALVEVEDENPMAWSYLGRISLEDKEFLI